MTASTDQGHSAGNPWDYDRGEIVADAIVHAIGMALGIIGAATMIVIASHSPRGLANANVLVYLLGLLAMLGCSAAYNLWPVSRAKWMLRRFDHSAIYLLIAATYTPFIAQLESGPVSVALLVGVWAVATIGIVLKLLLPYQFDALAIALYLVLGWSGLIAYKPVVAALPSSSLWLLLAGGVLYTAGVVFHLWRSLRFQNAIWHGFIVLAAGCHYMAVLDCIAAGRA